MVWARGGGLAVRRAGGLGPLSNGSAFAWGGGLYGPVPFLRPVQRPRILSREGVQPSSKLKTQQISHPAREPPINLHKKNKLGGGK